MSSEIEEKLPYIKQGQFGHTVDLKHIRAVEQYRDAMVADGWSIRPTYESHEGVERAATLSRDGFRSLILTRDNSGNGGRYHEGAIHIWGPDGLSIDPPAFYDFSKISERLRICSSCGAEGVDTQRYSFAGRCCEACLPKMRAEAEYPGWNN